MKINMFKYVHQNTLTHLYTPVLSYQSFGQSGLQPTHCSVLIPLVGYLLADPLMTINLLFKGTVEETVTYKCINIKITDES